MPSGTTKLAASLATENEEKREWADLPPELLTLIADRLDSRLCILRFRAVCRTWRMQCPLPSCKNILSSHLSPHGTQDFILTVNRVFLIESESSVSKWMISVDEFEPGKLILRTSLTDYSKSYNPQMVINLLDYRVTEVAKSYVYHRESNMSNFRNCYSIHNHKAIFSPKYDLTCEKRFKFFVLNEHGCLMIYSLEEKMRTYLPDMRFDDIVNYKGKIICFDHVGTAYTIDDESLGIVKYAKSLSLPVCNMRISYGEHSPALFCERTRLVASSKGLYLIVINEVKLCNILSMRVYKLNEEVKEWVCVQNLDNQIFFIRTDCSFSISSQMNVGFEKNCIYAYTYSFLPGDWDENPFIPETFVYHPSVDGSFVQSKSSDDLSIISPESLEQIGLCAQGGLVLQY